MFDSATEIDPLDRLAGNSETLAPSHRLGAFPAHDTTLTSAHRRAVAAIAAEISSGRKTRPVRCVRLVGHAATWRGISPKTYLARSRARAESVALALMAELTARGLKVRRAAETPETTLARLYACSPIRGADLTIRVGFLGDSVPLVPNQVTRGDATARANRARNRRVDVYLFRTAPIPKPRPRPKRRPKPKPRPRPNARDSARFCMRGDHTTELKELVRASARASHRARSRMRKLAAMNPQARQIAWNAGPERIWFGPYSEDGKAGFGFVQARIARIWDVFAGRPTPGRRPCADRLKVLTVEAFDCRRPGRKECRTIKDKMPPGDLWLREFPRNRLATENRKRDRLHACCAMQGDSGWSYRSYRKRRGKVDQYNQPMEPRPHKIFIGPAWFRKPPSKPTRLWRAARRVTVIHEIAHLAGVGRLSLDPVTGAWQPVETYGRRAVLRLARRDSKTARINAENYGYYVMGFLT